MTIKSMLLVNCDRLNHSIDRLAEIGKLPNDGLLRIAYSPEVRQNVSGLTYLTCRVN